MRLDAKRKTHENFSSPKGKIKCKEGEPSKESKGNKIWSKKVELLGLERADQIGWIDRVEKCFEVQDIRALEKLKSVYITIEDMAGLWFSVWRQKNQDSTWEMFSNALIRSFGESYGSGMLERLATLKQEHSAKDYMDRFERNMHWGPPGP